MAENNGSKNEMSNDTNNNNNNNNNNNDAEIKKPQYKERIKTEETLSDKSEEGSSAFLCHNLVGMEEHKHEEPLDHPSCRFTAASSQAPATTMTNDNGTRNSGNVASPSSSLLAATLGGISPVVVNHHHHHPKGIIQNNTSEANSAPARLPTTRSTAPQPQPQSQSISPPATTTQKKSKEKNLTMFEMIEDCLAMSLVIFLYAEIRALSATGRINTKFETLTVDSDLVPRATAAQLAGLPSSSSSSSSRRNSAKSGGGKYIHGVSPAQIMAVLLVELRREVRAQKRIAKNRYDTTTATTTTTTTTTTTSSPHATPNKTKRSFFLHESEDDDEDDEDEENFSLLGIIKNKETRKKVLEDDMQSLLSMYNEMIAKDLNYTVPEVHRKGLWMSREKGGGGVNNTNANATGGENGDGGGGDAAAAVSNEMNAGGENNNTTTEKNNWMSRFVSGAASAPAAAATAAATVPTEQQQQQQPPIQRHHSPFTFHHHHHHQADNNHPSVTARESILALSASAISTGLPPPTPPVHHREERYQEDPNAGDGTLNVEAEGGQSNNKSSTSDEFSEHDRKTIPTSAKLSSRSDEFLDQDKKKMQHGQEEDKSFQNEDEEEEEEDFTTTGGQTLSTAASADEMEKEGKISISQSQQQQQQQRQPFRLFASSKTTTDVAPCAQDAPTSDQQQQQQQQHSHHFPRLFSSKNLPPTTDEESSDQQQQQQQQQQQHHHHLQIRQNIKKSIEQHRQQLQQIPTKPFQDVSDTLFEEMNIVHPSSAAQTFMEEEDDDEEDEDEGMEDQNKLLMEKERLELSKNLEQDGNEKEILSSSLKGKKKKKKVETSGTKLSEEELLDLMEEAAESRVYNRLDFMAGFFKEKSVSQVLIKSKVKIVWLNDWYPLKDLIYVITVDTEKRNVMVAFRGCVTKSDWNHAFDAKWKKVRNPVPDTGDFKSTQFSKRPQTIKVHRGFHRYLFRRRKDTGTCKYDEIATKVHEYGMDMGDDYTLNVTGHSLGGGLATLFGFYASTDERFTNNGTIKIINFGCPYVGGHAFGASFRHQERAKKLQLARMHNARDWVTHLPFNMTMSTRGSKFQHVGIGVELPRCKKFVVPCIGRRYPRVTYVDDESYLASYGRALRNNCFFHLPLPWKFKYVHKLYEHHKRVLNARKICTERKHPLSNMTLDDMYEKFAGVTNYS